MQHNSNSPLLRLPAEIRNQIYDYLIRGQTYKLQHKHNDVGWIFYHPYGNPALDSISYWQTQTYLSQTCRQLRHDTAVLFFQRNTFGADFPECSKTLDKCMELLQPHQANTIRTIRWEPSDTEDDRDNLKRTLGKWSGIKNVELDFLWSDEVGVYD
jgi:hypothetical protein